MLPRRYRLTSPSDFDRTIRRGRRYAGSTVVAHYWCCDEAIDVPRVGLAVGRTVGGSVVRHRVARKLREVSRAHLDRLPAGSLLVIRARPTAAQASWRDLDADVHSALTVLAPRSVAW